jgi:hypothetical protein
MDQVNSSQSDFVDRIRGLRSDKRQSVSTVMRQVRAGYFGTETDIELDAAMEDMFDDIIETLDAAAALSKDTDHIGRMSEGYPLLLLGASGTRKTSSIARMIHKRHEFAGFNYHPALNASPLISVKAPSPCTLRVLGITIARAMGLPSNDSMAENVVWDLLIENLPTRGVRFVHIDEFQHVMENRNSVDIAKIRNAMKRLVQTPEHPVWLLLSGMPEIGTVIEGDTQLWRRKSYVLFRELEFPRDTGNCLGMIKFFATDKAGLSCASFEKAENLHRLMHASLFRLGIAIDIVVKAIRVALKAGSPSLELAHFASGYRVFTGCPEASNPFVALGDFTQIEVDKYVTRLLEHGESRGTTKARGTN